MASGFNKALDLWSFCNNIDENISLLWWFMFIGNKKIKYSVKLGKTIFCRAGDEIYACGAVTDSSLHHKEESSTIFFPFLYRCTTCCSVQGQSVGTSSKPKGNSLLNWNDAIYCPKRWHFIIQRTLTPWMSNTEHAGKEMEYLALP